MLALFTEEAEYFTRPYLEPFRGADAIADWWIAEEEWSEPTFDGGVLVEGDAPDGSGRVGVIRGRTDYPGHGIYSNLWEVHLADDGRARRFVEWYMLQK